MKYALEPAYFWMNVAFLALGTITIRGSLIALSARVRISERVREIFSYIPAAILPAFVAPAVFFHPGRAEWAMGHERLGIMLLAIAVSYFTRSTLATIVSGLVALYLATSL